MKTPYIHENFLLQNKYSQELYHVYAAPLPIIDYHCHLSPKDIAEDRRFNNLTQIWLESDHYKWRAMRSAGVEERFITGNATDWEKFQKWAEVVPLTLRNPLYHWTHLELNRPFGITNRLLDAKTARSIWDDCNAKLAMPEFSTLGILEQMNVEVVCTTDDPIDSLEHHRTIRNNAHCRVMVLPTFRPDKAMAVEDPAAFMRYVGLLSRVAEIEIRSYNDFVIALRRRHDYFHHNGCRLSDHGLETIYAEDYTETQIQAIFARLLQGETLDPIETCKFKSCMLYEFAVMDWEKEWTQQFHLGALRNNNSRLMRAYGSDSGFDSIGDWQVARPLAKFLNRLDEENELAKTILYNLNPRDNEVVAAMIGNFQDGTIAGKLQYGPAWWFLDQIDGMTKQLNALSNMGLLSQFVGMLTDSRSVLSYVRHEYFRKILCNMLGTEMEMGLLPSDVQSIGKLVQDVVYLNAKRYFGFCRSMKTRESMKVRRKGIPTFTVVEAE